MFNGLFLIILLMPFYLLTSIFTKVCPGLSFTSIQVHFLSHLNGLAHDDYIAALENLHCYFDYRYLNC